MKIGSLSILIIPILTGCTTLADRTEEAINTAVNPEKRSIVIRYTREGNTTHYQKTVEDCAGRFCDNPGE